MRTSIKLLLILLIVGGVGAGAYKPAMDYWKWRNKVNWQLAEVVSGKIVTGRQLHGHGQTRPLRTCGYRGLGSRRGPVQGLQRRGQEGRTDGLDRSSALPGCGGSRRGDAQFARSRCLARGGPARASDERQPAGLGAVQRESGLRIPGRTRPVAILGGLSRGAAEAGPRGRGAGQGESLRLRRSIWITPRSFPPWTA